MDRKENSELFNDVNRLGLVIEHINIRRLDMPLKQPYRLAYRTFERFEPIVVGITGSDGRVGWGDGHISPGSSSETREGGWEFCQRTATEIAGMTLGEALALIAARKNDSKVAATALSTALEVLAESRILEVPHKIELPLLTPVNGLTSEDIESEINQKIDQGFRTFKVKVGYDVEADLERLSTIQKVVQERATLRLDANRGFNQKQGEQFASAINPTSIELFEQPCPAEDWEANAAVARVSTVPLGLDEPICSIPDIERAAGIDGVGFCKLKLKRFGSLSSLYQGLKRVRELGMEPVLGDGLGSEFSGWMEACAAQTTISNAGEFNGFLKLRDRLFDSPLVFEEGKLILPQGFSPRINMDKLDFFTQEQTTFSKS